MFDRDYGNLVSLYGRKCLRRDLSEDQYEECKYSGCDTCSDAAKQLDGKRGGER